MKIVFTVTNDLTYDNRMFRICSSLAKNGYEVILTGRLRKNSKPVVTQLYKQKRIRCVFNRGKLFYAEYNIRLFFYLLFTSTDCICSIDLDTILPGYMVSRFKGLKFVYDAHEYFTQVPEVIERPLVQKFWERIEQWIVPKVKNAYTVNKSIATLFQAKYQSQFLVIYNAPEYIEQPETENFDKKLLIYQGALNASRGLEQLIDTMQEINAILWIIGEGDLSKQLRQRVNDLRLNEKIFFKGMIPPNELFTYTRQATIGINVSENAGLSYFYSLNNKFFDYIHAGIPAITNDFPEYEAINNQFRVSILSRCSVDLLTNDINKLLNDKELYLNLKQNCVIAAKYYCWQNEESKLLKFYAQLR